MIECPRCGGLINDASQPCDNCGYLDLSKLKSSVSLADLANQNIKADEGKTIRKLVVLGMALALTLALVSGLLVFLYSADNSKVVEEVLTSTPETEISEDGESFHGDIEASRIGSELGGYIDVEAGNLFSSITERHAYYYLYGDDFTIDFISDKYDYQYDIVAVEEGYASEYLEMLKEIYFEGDGEVELSYQVVTYGGFEMLEYQLIGKQYKMIYWSFNKDEYTTVKIKYSLYEEEGTMNTDNFLQKAYPLISSYGEDE